MSVTGCRKNLSICSALVLMDRHIKDLPREFHHEATEDTGINLLKETLYWTTFQKRASKYYVKEADTKLVLVCVPSAGSLPSSLFRLRPGVSPSVLSPLQVAGAMKRDNNQNEVKGDFSDYPQHQWILYVKNDWVGNVGGANCSSQTEKQKLFLTRRRGWNRTGFRIYSRVSWYSFFIFPPIFSLINWISW